MNKSSLYVVVVLAILFALVAGCMNTPEPTIPETKPVNHTQTATPTVPPITPTFTTTPPPEPVVVITTKQPGVLPEVTYEAIEPDWEPTPEIIPPAESDITKINFTKFVSDDFMAQYPQDWAVVCQTFEISGMTVHGQDVYKKEARLVTFTSADGRTKMMVTVYDFIAPGRATFTPTIEDVRKVVEMIYANVSGSSAVYNYEKYLNDQHVMAVRYDVLLPEWTTYAPYQYTEETFVTWEHMFNIDFISIDGKLQEYKDLKYLMLKNIVTEGTNKRKWW